MNQRASHFSLGNTSQPFGSVYAKDYGRKASENNQIKINNPFRGSSLNHGQHGSFATTNKTLLKAWDHVERAKLDDQKLKQLKTHHFKLGTYAPSNVLTTNKIYHSQKQIDGQASKNQQESKNKMRSHNHDFKEQSFTNYKSSYANQYNPKELQPNEKVGGQQVGNAISFGNNVLPMVTTSGASFTHKEAHQNRVKPEQTLGITLGGKSQPMQTINQLYYTQKQISKASLPQSTMKQLRSTHFQLGQMAPKYVTQSNNYRSVFSQAKQPRNNIAVYESGTWVDKQAKFNAMTTYQRQLAQRQVKPFQRNIQVTRSGMDLGGHSANYQSEFKSNYVIPSNPTYNPLSINKKSSIVIGSQNIKAYQTEHKSNYKVNDLQQAKVKIDIKKLSRQDHFSIGGSSNIPKGTVYQDEHRLDLQNRSKVFHKQNQ